MYTCRYKHTHMYVNICIYTTPVSSQYIHAGKQTAIGHPAYLNSSAFGLNSSLVLSKAIAITAYKHKIEY